ncbi:hypothetical protein TNCV_4875221 [Trichonephila clavipes]|nr:hypothetical protein TNCV_4875221 [Trichonephila clavipes]
MSYDYAPCSRSLDCLFGLGSLGKIKFQERFRFVRAQVPLSGKEIGGEWSVTQMLSFSLDYGLKIRDSLP